MNNLDELMNKLCPNGVCYKKLGELIIQNPKSKIGAKKAESFEKGNYPFYTSGKTIYYTTEFFVDGENIFVNDGGQADIKYYDGKSAYADHVISFKPLENVNGRYIYHYLMKCRDYINEKMFRGSGIKNIQKKEFFEMMIPVPPLEVQSEIVHILDRFTLLTAELTAELTARQKQYEYYRDLLLENNTAEKVKLGDCLLKIENIKWKQTDESHQYIDLSSVDRDKHVIVETKEIDKTNAPSRAQQIVKTNDVLFGGTRPMLKRSCLVTETYNNEICSTGFCVLRADTSKVLPKWIYFMISTNSFYNYVEQNQKGASYPAISDGDVKNYKISLPPIDEQEKLVELLDKFEKICNDISNGLPAEIEKRQKQYEYYRDLLLSFKEVQYE